MTHLPPDHRREAAMRTSQRTGSAFTNGRAFLPRKGLGWQLLAFVALGAGFIYGLLSIQ